MNNTVGNFHQVAFQLKSSREGKENFVGAHRSRPMRGKRFQDSFTTFGTIRV